MPDWYVVNVCPECWQQDNAHIGGCPNVYRVFAFHQVRVVPESVMDALREENARLTRERDEDHRSMVDAWTERDALRARVEELEAGLRRVRQSIEPTMPEPRDLRRDRLLEVINALLSGGSQEPRPDTGWKLGVEAQRERDEKDARLGIRHRRPDTKETKR